MSCYSIVGLRVNHRVKNAVKLQEALTKYGCNINARIGLHESSSEFCSDDGLIILQVCGDAATIESMLKDLGSVEGVIAKHLDLN